MKQDSLTRKAALSNYRSQYIVVDQHFHLISSCDELVKLNQLRLVELLDINPILGTTVEALFSSQSTADKISCIQFQLFDHEILADLSFNQRNDHVEILIEDFTTAYNRVAEFQKERNNSVYQYVKQMAKAEALEKSKSFMIHTFEDLSHELRNPLNSLTGLSQSLQDSQENDQVQALQSTVKILVQIADNLLDISSLELNKIKLKPNHLYLRDLISDLSGTFTYQAKVKNISFHTVIDPSVPDSIWTDKSRLTQVLYNLLGNAFKFTHQGNIQLSITSDDQFISFEVSDTGIGIDEEKLKSILDRFSQANADIQQVYGGLGLGLSISKQIVALMDGVLSVKSKLKMGSQFSFKIPLIQGTVNETKKLDNSKLNHLKVLLVDDDQMNLLVQKRQLLKLGLAVTVESSGLHALQRLKNGAFDLLITDFQMPDISGSDLIKEANKQNKIKSVLLTGHSTQSARLIGTEAERVLTKPVDIHELETTLLDLL